MVMVMVTIMVASGGGDSETSAVVKAALSSDAGPEAGGDSSLDMTSADCLSDLLPGILI